MTQERGASGIEYSLLVMLIAVAAVIALRTLGPTVADRLTEPWDGAPTTTTVTVLGETLTKDCAGKDHAHKGCR